ncbi:hypothetical protein QVD17_01151 [Tagetes erecta]|uniref:Uncharacterized protein n=1 Tax=Tagetes erecta TaxID=13708 RepID=A0AAD8L4G5_TARER|nr:hypothetical protein QVD17_01151 [Tagetes erecta]
MSRENDEIKSKLLVKEDDDELNKVLLPRKGGLSTPNSSVKKNHKVQWNDNDGNNLTQVLEYQPSEASDFDDDESDACICNIM